MTDWSTNDGATNLARKIRAYWQARGYEYVFVDVVMVTSGQKNSRKPVYGVKSNIKNGYPPRYLYK